MMRPISATGIGFIVSICLLVSSSCGAVDGTRIAIDRSENSSVGGAPPEVKSGYRFKVEEALLETYRSYFRYADVSEESLRCSVVELWAPFSDEELQEANITSALILQEEENLVLRVATEEKQRQAVKNSFDCLTDQEVFFFFTAGSPTDEAAVACLFGSVDMAAFRALIVDSTVVEGDLVREAEIEAEFEELFSNPEFERCKKKGRLKLPYAPTRLTLGVGSAVADQTHLDQLPLAHPNTQHHLTVSGGIVRSIVFEPVWLLSDSGRWPKKFGSQI